MTSRWVSFARLGLSGVAVCAVCAPIAGCDLISSWFQQDITLPIDLTSPPQDFNVTDAVASAEGSACSDTAADSCVAIKAICATDTTRTDCDTNPSLPAEFPSQIDVGGNTVDANDLMTQMGIDKATELKVAMPVDVSGALAGQGVDVSNKDAIKAVTIAAVSMQWPENTLTFDAPPLDLYITTEDVGTGAVDAGALITAGTVKKVGTVGIDTNGDGTIDVGQTAGSTADVPVNFVDGGNALFNDAVKSAKFTIVTAVPDGHGFALKAKAGDATKVLKPTGAGKVQLKATLTYTISAADVVGGAQNAAGGT